MRIAPLALALVVSAAVIAGATRADAQITAASLSGVVTDETGAVLQGVEVTASNAEHGITRTTMTRADGSYLLPGLPPGVYELHASLAGFATARRTALTLAVAQEASLGLTLRVGANDQVVVAGSTLVDLRTSALSALVDEKTIEALPLNGRNFIDLAILQTGVAAFTNRLGAGSTSRGQQINVNGANGRANSYLLDGANMAAYAGSSVATAADTTLGVDMIQEFRVVTNAFSADYGRAMGGVVSVVSKSGTNTLHGSGFEFFRNEALDARNVFDVEKPPFDRHQFGFTAGGAIRQNKTFFFGGGEWLHENLGVTQVTEVPSVAARSGPVAPSVLPYLDLFPLPNGPDLGDGLARYTFPFDRRTRDTFAQLRVDHNFSSHSALFVRYTADAATRRQPTLLPQFFTNQDSHNHWLTVEEKRTVSVALLNTARFSYSRVDLGAAPGDDGVDPTLGFIPGQTIGNLFIASREYGPDRQNPQYQDIEYFTFSDDVVHSRGRHLFKAGVLIERAHTGSETSTNLRGRYTFTTMQRFLAGTPSRFVGVLPGYDVARARRNTTFGFYLQDDLKAHSRLTLNLGLRYEFYTVPNDVADRDSTLRNIATDKTFTVGPIFENPSLRNIGPRIGFAWDASGDGRSSVRGGAGLYFDTDGPFNSSLLGAAFSPPFATSVNIANPAFPHPAFEQAPPERAARGLDYHVRQPRMIAGNLNYQREALPGLVLSVGYAMSRGDQLVQSIEGNPALPQTLPGGGTFFPEVVTRRNPNWDSIDFRTTGGRSSYHALQLSATKRFNRGYRWQAAYTFGKAVDETQGQVPGDSTNSSVYPQEPLDPRSDRGPADFDVRQIFTMNFSWELPFTGPVAGGWQFNGLGILRSGVPFSPSIQTQNNWSRSGNTAQGSEDRPNLRAGVDPDAIVLGGSTRYFDPNAFELQPRGLLGNVPRNMLTGPGFINAHVSVVKSVRWQALGSGGAVELRLEAFNVFNRTNFGLPNRVVFAGAAEHEAPLPTAGQITTTASDARQIQLGVKVKF